MRLQRANPEGAVPVPARLEDLLPSEHLARRAWRLADGILDLSAFYQAVVVHDGEDAAQLRTAQEWSAGLQQAVGELPAAEAAKAPKGKARVSSTDRWARVIRMPDARYGPTCTCRYASDGWHDIVAASVILTTASSDQQRFVPMLDQVPHSSGWLARSCAVDGGFLMSDTLDQRHGHALVLALVPGPTRAARHADCYPLLPGDLLAVAAWRVREGY